LAGHEIIIRKAVPADVKAIWHLLHCESKAWDTGHILKEINSLYVLSWGKKLVGVLHSTAVAGDEKIAWVAVHPLYPEGSVRTFLTYGLLGVVCRLPEAEITQRIKSSLSKYKHKQGPWVLGLNDGTAGVNT